MFKFFIEIKENMRDLYIYVYILTLKSKQYLIKMSVRVVVTLVTAAFKLWFHSNCVLQITFSKKVIQRTAQKQDQMSHLPFYFIYSFDDLNCTRNYINLHYLSFDKENADSPTLNILRRKIFFFSIYTCIVIQVSGYVNVGPSL